MNTIISLDPPQIIQNDGNPVHPSRLKYDNCNLELLNNANIPNTKQIIDHGKKMNRSRVDFFLTTPNCLSVLHDVYYLQLSSSLFDHKPVIMSMRKSDGIRPPRIDNCLLTIPGHEQI